MAMFLVVRGSFAGKHSWPGAPECYKELRRPHSHKFGFEVVIETTPDREIEFLDFANCISATMDTLLRTYPTSSCEALADKLLLYLRNARWKLKAGLLKPLKERVVSVEVNEDGGCGAMCVWLPEDDRGNHGPDTNAEGGLPEQFPGFPPVISREEVDGC